MTKKPVIDAEQHRVKAIQIAAVLSVVVNAVLAGLKIFVGLRWSSFAVLGDGFDSLADVASSLVTIFAAAVLIRPPDLDHPYGHQRADTIAAKALSFIIFFTGAQLSYATFTQFLSREVAAVPGLPAIIVTAVSVVGKIAIAIHLEFRGRHLESLMLKANAKNMRSDIVMSLVVLLGLFFAKYAELGVIDLIAGFVVGIWIMKTAVEIFLDTNMELMDGLNDPAMYFRVFDAVERVEGAHNPHRARIRTQGPWHIIDLDVEVEPSLSVAEAHEICRKVEHEIRSAIPKVYDIMVHIEPLGNDEDEERFGLDRASL